MIVFGMLAPDRHVVNLVFETEIGEETPQLGKHPVRFGDFFEKKRRRQNRYYYRRRE